MYELVIKIFKTKYLKGFTLAEVLISLAIMGAIMAITLPSLMQNTFNNSYTSTLKKTYSMLEQATNTIMLNNSGTLEGAFTSTSDAIDKYSKLLEINKICSTGSVKGNCWANSSKSLSGAATQEGFNADANYQGVVLADGTSLLFYVSSSNCTAAGVSVNLPYSSDPNHLCGYVVADINGYSNGSSQFGKDDYMFLLGPKGIVPAGDPHTVYNDLTGNCNTQDTSRNGYGCTAAYLNGEDVLSVEPPPPCSPSTETETLACDAGFTGNKTRTRSSTCPGPTWSAWSTWNTGGCVATCTPPAPETETAPCGVGFTGNKTRTKTYSCPGPTSSVSAWNESGCTPLPDEWCHYEYSPGNYDCTSCPGGSGGYSTEQECLDWL